MGSGRAGRVERVDERLSRLWHDDHLVLGRRECGVMEARW
jgi:hypothetical protein